MSIWRMSMPRMSRRSLRAYYVIAFYQGRQRVVDLADYQSIQCCKYRIFAHRKVQGPPLPKNSIWTCLAVVEAYSARHGKARW